MLVTVKLQIRLGIAPRTTDGGCPRHSDRFATLCGWYGISLTSCGEICNKPQICSKGAIMAADNPKAYFNNRSYYSPNIPYLARSDEVKSGIWYW